MLTIRASNKNLTTGTKYSYLNSNTASGVTDIVVSNIVGFSDDDFLLLGEWGSETSELVQIDSRNTNTHTITLKAATKFAHPESTKVVIVSYDKVKFYWTATDTFNSDILLETVDVQADSLFTIYQDSDHSSGFGFFKFYNSANAKITSESNAIPYNSFANQSVKKVLDSFYSILNSKEKKLISDTDALNYLNEAYAIVVSELNLVNDNYNVPADKDYSIVGGTSEYDLPDDFSKVISLYNGSDRVEVPFIALSDVPLWNSVTSNEVRYSLRNDKLVITPEPTTSTTYTLKYKKKSDIVSSYYSNIDLPDHGEYLLLDYMMFRSSQKLTNGKEQMFLGLFKENIQRLKISSHKRSNENSSWNIKSEANI